MQMPARIEQRARELVYGGDWTAPPARSAATVVLMRDGEQGVETVLMRKARGFATGMYVFPGGAVEESDAQLGDPWKVAAIRETFEECGVLLTQPELRQVPGAARENTFERLLDELGVRPALGDLVDFAHWVTPEVESRRFDTKFFAAVVPSGQSLGEVSLEHRDSGWYRPEDALRLPILPPTAAALAQLQQCNSVADVLTRDWSPQPIMPRPIPRGNDEIAWVLVNPTTGEEVS